MLKSNCVAILSAINNGILSKNGATSLGTNELLLSLKMEFSFN